MCNKKSHSWDITEPIIWLWEDLPYPRPDLLCECGKVELGIEMAKKYAIKGSLYGKKPQDAPKRCLCGETATINDTWCESCFPNTGC